MNPPEGLPPYPPVPAGFDRWSDPFLSPHEVLKVGVPMAFLHHNPTEWIVVDYGSYGGATGRWWCLEAVRAEPEVKNPCPKCGKAMRRFSPWPAFFCEGCNKGAAEAESSPTPETDAHQAKEGMAHDWLWRDFARRLERERDALKSENGRLRGYLESIANETAATWVADLAREALAGKDAP